MRWFIAVKGAIKIYKNVNETIVCKADYVIMLVKHIEVSVRQKFGENRWYSNTNGSVPDLIFLFKFKCLLYRSVIRLVYYTKNNFLGKLDQTLSFGLQISLEEKKA